MYKAQFRVQHNSSRLHYQIVCDRMDSFLMLSENSASCLNLFSSQKSNYWLRCCSQKGQLDLSKGLFPSFSSYQVSINKTCLKLTTLLNSDFALPSSYTILWHVLGIADDLLAKPFANIQLARGRVSLTVYFWPSRSFISSRIYHRN